MTTQLWNGNGNVWQDRPVGIDMDDNVVWNPTEDKTMSRSPRQQHNVDKVYVSAYE